MRRFLVLLVVAFISIPFANGRNALNTDEMKMLQDSGGWEILSMSKNQVNGFPTQHPCFDGRPHPGQCSGVLILTKSNTFSQTVRIQGQSVKRTGTYQLNGDQLAFVDELGTQDGPYTLTLNAQTKSLILQMPQIRMELMLESEYRKMLEEQKKRDHPR
ncbi:MAG: hypothetical protein JO182_29590 [Acidobacteriaceae bacterium]|nr:hypothetical protein [Acidobacteriaceae bacterium]